MLAFTRVYADGAVAEIERISGIFVAFQSLVAQLTILAIGIAFMFFFWNLATIVFKIGTGDTKVFAEARSRIMWSILALFVLTSVLGIYILSRGCSFWKRRGFAQSSHNKYSDISSTLIRR